MPTKSAQRRKKRSRLRRDPEPPHVATPTALAAEALRTGVLPIRSLPREPEVAAPEAERMQAGDPDVSPLANEYSGEEVPGGSQPTPDQNQVDEIGRAYGLQEKDGANLRSSAEILEERDRRRS